MLPKMLLKASRLAFSYKIFGRTLYEIAWLKWKLSGSVFNTGDVSSKSRCEILRTSGVVILIRFRSSSGWSFFLYTIER